MDEVCTERCMERFLPFLVAVITGSGVAELARHVPETSRIIFFVALQLSEAGGYCRRCMEELSKTNPTSLGNPADSLELYFPTFCPRKNP